MLVTAQLSSVIWPGVLTGVLTHASVTYMNTATSTSTHGTVLVGADSDGHGGYVRGISGINGTFTALTGATSKSFKTLAGAVRYLARFGYDAYGRRV